MLTRKSDGARPRIPVTVPAAVAAVFVAAVFCLAGIEALAQGESDRDWNDSVDPLEGGVGLHYGKLGGHGLSFRLPIEWWLYFQVSGGIWHTSDQKQHNIGFELNYLLRQDQRMRIFIAAGSAYFFDEEQVQPDVWESDKHWNVGAGVGLELLMGKRWSMLIEGDFVHHGDSGDIKVIPQAGIYYYW